MRFEEIRSDDNKDNNVDTLSTCDEFKCVVSGVEADDHEDDEDMKGEEESDIFVLESLVLVVLGLPAEVHLGCYVHSAIEKYQKSEDEKQSWKVVVHFVVFLN